MNWLHYLAEANLYLGVFYLAYCVFLNKETYYQLNRIYLVGSCIIAFVLPVLQVGTLKPMPATESYTVIHMVPPPPPMAPVTIVAVEQPYQLTLTDVLWYGYLLGTAILLLVLAIRLYNLFSIVRKQKCVEQGSYKLIYIKDSQSAFSFFNYLFIGTDAPGVDTIIRHEQVHISQKHSADIIFLEVLKIINWFNPFIYLLQNSLKTVHEYIADEQTATYETDALAYSSFLVNNAYGVGGPSITQPFSTYHLLKKRIIMLNQQRSGNLARLKYLVAVPICAGLLCASTLGFSKTYGWVDLAPKHITQQPKRVPPPPPTMPPKPKVDQVKFPPPLVIPDEHVALFTYLKKIEYPQNIVKNAISGSVVVSYTINDDYKLSDIKLIKSTKAFEEGASTILNALNAYTGTVTDKPGEHILGLNFYNYRTGFMVHKDKEFKNDPRYSGEIYILIPPPKPKVDQVKFPPPIVKPKGNGVKQITYYINPASYTISGLRQISSYLHEAGYQMEFNKIGADQLKISLETLPELGWHETVSTKFDMEALKKLKRVIAVGADNTIKRLYVRSITKLEQLHATISPPPPPPMPPKPKVGQVKFPPPIVKPNVVKHVWTPAENAHLQDFYTTMQRSVNYPKEAKSSNIQGRVIARFTVANNHIIDIKIDRGLDNSINEQVIQVLQNNSSLQIPPGKYVLPFSFELASGNSAPTTPPASRTNNTVVDKNRKITTDNNTVWGLNEIIIVAYAN